MDSRPALLVESNPDDEMITLRELEKKNILNPVVVGRDGMEALAHLEGDGGPPLAGPGFGLSANSYIRKPVDFLEFSSVSAQVGL